MFGSCLSCDFVLQYVTNEGTEFIFHTNKGAPNYRLIKINIDDCAQDKWQTLVSEHEKDVLSWAVCVAQDKLVLCYIHDVKVCIQPILQK